MDPDISLALAHHRELNANPHLWARLEMIQFPEFRAVRLMIGNKRNGVKERASITRHYSVWADGSAYWYEV